MCTRRVYVLYSLFGNMANEYSSTAQFCGQTEINLGFPISSLSSVSIAHKHTMNHTKVRSTKANVSRFIELSRQISFYRYIILSWQLFSKCSASYHWEHWENSEKLRHYINVYLSAFSVLPRILYHNCTSNKYHFDRVQFGVWHFRIFAFVHINYVIYVMLLAVVAKINKWCISLCKYFVNRKSCYHIATFSWSFSYSFGRCDIEYNTVSRLFRFVVVCVLWLFVCIPTVLYVFLVPILYIWSHVRLHCILPNAIRI